MIATWSYKDRDTIIQRLDPRARVIFIGCATLAAVLVWDLRLLLIPFGLALVQLLLTLLTCRGGVGVYDIEHPIWQGRVLGLRYSISAERLAFAMSQLVRLFALAALSVVLLFTMHPGS